jgi:hypothetical protein
MTTHLSPDDLAAAADGTLEDAGTARFDRRAALAHLDQCAECRAAVAALSAAMADLKADTVPEPSPLFWDHFSARIREATAAESTPARSVWLTGRPVLALGALAAVALLLLVWSSSRDRRDLPPTMTVVGETTADAEVAWQAMSEIAAAMTPDDVRSATAPAPERSSVLSDLSADERRAFVELLKTEIGDVQ